MTKPVSSVLIVDDQPEVRKALRRILERTAKIRYVVAESADGDEAVATAKISPPDAVLLDISMPGKTGIAAIPELLKVAPEAKVLVLSSHYGMGDEVLAMGAHAFLPKTTPPRVLLRTLENLLGR